MFNGVAMLSLRGAHEHGPTDIGPLAQFLRGQHHSKYQKVEVRNGTNTKLGGYNVTPLERIDAFCFGCLLHLQAMLVRACEEHHRTNGVQYTLKPRDDVCGDKRMEVSDVRALRTTSASRYNDERLATHEHWGKI